jgi:hypothetical protein
MPNTFEQSLPKGLLWKSTEGKTQVQGKTTTRVLKKRCAVSYRAFITSTCSSFVRRQSPTLPICKTGFGGEYNFKRGTRPHPKAVCSKTFGKLCAAPSRADTGRVLSPTSRMMILITTTDRCYSLKHILLQMAHAETNIVPRMPSLPGNQAFVMVILTTKAAQRHINCPASADPLSALGVADVPTCSRSEFLKR